MKIMEKKRRKQYNLVKPAQWTIQNTQQKIGMPVESYILTDI